MNVHNIILYSGLSKIRGFFCTLIVRSLHNLREQVSTLITSGEIAITKLVLQSHPAYLATPPMPGARDLGKANSVPLPLHIGNYLTKEAC